MSFKTFNKLVIAVAILFVGSCNYCFKPEKSKLLEPCVDPSSGVLSYKLVYGAPDDNKQSLYFVTKSMTDDARYLVFWYYEGNENKGIVGHRRHMLADFKKDKVYDLGISWMFPFIETKQNYIIYADQSNGFYRRDFNNPEKEIFLCPFPEELTSLGKISRIATHLTLTQDREKAFLDAEIITPEGTKRYIQGMLNLEEGTWDQWGETEWDCNHGQLNPIDDSLALCAWESAWTGLGKQYKDSTGIYPRMWLVNKNSKTLVPAEARNAASHEIWDDDGKGFSWCGGGVYHMDLASGIQEQWIPDPEARHNYCSPDNKYVVYDQAPLGWWRGCPWRVAFYNRETGKYVWVYDTREPLRPKDKQSNLHPDPHPHFVADGRYIVCTAGNADGHMDLLITPVSPLIKMTE